MKKKIIFIISTFCLILIAMELFLRLLGFGYNLLYSPPSYKGGDYTVFCIGESTTRGIGASNPILKGYPRQLEEMLNEKFSGKNIRCFFDRTIGQNTSEVLRKLPFYINKYKPRLIILMVGCNNWWNLDRSNILLYSKNKSVSELFLRTLVFLDRFRIWKLFKWIYYSLLPPKDRWNYWYNKEIEISPEEYYEIISKKYNFEIFHEIAYYDLREMVKTCNNNNIKMIICSYPRGGSSGLFFIQRRLAEEFQIPFVDNYSFFEKIPDANEYFRDISHPNDKGYRLVAENIYNCIVTNRLIQEDY